MGRSYDIEMTPVECGDLCQLQPLSDCDHRSVGGAERETAILASCHIDHTLIETHGIGGRIYADAFHSVIEHELKTMPLLSGRTEPVIFREALVAHGPEQPTRDVA